MITGSLLHLQLYKSIHPLLATAIDHLLNTDLASLPAGKYEIAGDALFYMVNEYSTKPAAECEPERHRRYTDIQIMIDGTEQFGYTPYYSQKPSTDFLPGNDVAFYSLPAGQLSHLILAPGEFILFFPSDIHQPEVQVGKPAPVKKLVVKVDLGGQTG